MAFEGYIPKATEGMYELLVAFTGAGAADPTKLFGKDVAVNWISTGLYELTFTDDPGTLMCPGGPCWQATTPAGVKGYTAVFGDYNSGTKKIRVSIYNSSFALADLAAAQTVSFAMAFKR